MSSTTTAKGGAFSFRQDNMILVCWFNLVRPRETALLILNSSMTKPLEGKNRATCFDYQGGPYVALAHSSRQWYPFLAPRLPPSTGGSSSCSGSPGVVRISR